VVAAFSLARREIVRSLNMGYALSGKTALVTGANRGIGEALVDALVAAGVKKVYAAARNISTLDPLVDRHGSRVTPLQLDVTNAAQIAAAAVGVYPGPIDTRMGEVLTLEKASPADAARAIVAGIIAGDEEIFPDKMSGRGAGLLRGSEGTRAAGRRGPGRGLSLAG
jgi:NAD(P)-dependent dehydrogenase (short-subunit alcohol dehydrogenase family)